MFPRRPAADALLPMVGLPGAGYCVKATTLAGATEAQVGPRCSRSLDPLECRLVRLCVPVVASKQCTAHRIAGSASAAGSYPLLWTCGWWWFLISVHVCHGPGRGDPSPSHNCGLVGVYMSGSCCKARAFSSTDVAPFTGLRSPVVGWPEGNAAFDVAFDQIMYGSDADAVSISIVPFMGGMPAGSETAVAVGRVGDGAVAYLGDINWEKPTLDIIRALTQVCAGCP